MSDYRIEQYNEVKKEIASALASAGRAPDGAELIAVSKTFPASDILAVYNAGQRRFGESKADELAAKAAALPGDIEWHFIGHLQSNKVRSVVAHAHVIHSVDSAKLLERIERIAGEEHVQVEALLEVNISGEASKFGLTPEAAEELARQSSGMHNVKVTGFMTMAPEVAGEDELIRVFSGLKKLADKCGLGKLSMGMSGDFKTAIACGATLVRIGTAIFGKRDYSK